MIPKGDMPGGKRKAIFHKDLSPGEVTERPIVRHWKCNFQCRFCFWTHRLKPHIFSTWRYLRNFIVIVGPSTLQRKIPRKWSWRFAKRFAKRLCGITIFADANSPFRKGSPAVPRDLHMTYVSDQKRWTKWYRGKTYSVSCKQLECPPSRAASWIAANAWWEAKQAEIDAREEKKNALPAPGTPEAQLRLIETWLGRPVQSELEAKAALLAIFQRDQPEVVYQAFLGPDKDAQIRTAVENAITEPAEHHRSIEGVGRL